MDRVPLEVFTKITSYLKCSEKFELLRVCQYWRNCVLSTNLYNDVSTKYKSRFQQAMSTLKGQELYTRQVHRLQIVKPEIDFLTVLQLPSLFPHLKEFIWEDYSNENYDEQTLPVDLEQQLQHWQKLASIKETNRYLYMPLLLKSSQFPNLAQLKINLHFSHADIGNDIINYLDHAPKLNYLDITHVSLNLQQLETLHRKAPQLETLCLGDVTQLAVDFDTLYESETLLEKETRQLIIEPAIKLHTLNLNRIFLGVSYGIELHWLRYISEKYTNMANFTISGVGMGSNPLPFYENGLKWIAENCRKIEKYRVKIFPLTPVILSAMDASGVRLKTLDIMSEGTALDQLVDLSHSHQKDYINSISVKSFNDGDNIFDTLQKFPQLRELDISSTANITLNTSLKKLKQLESLSLSSGAVCLNRKDSDSYSIPLQLKILNLEQVWINNKEDVFGYIAASSPYLSTLCIQGQVSDTKITPLKVHFPSQYFRSIKVYILRNSYYKVDNDREVTWYRFKGKTLEEKLQHEYSGYQDNFYVSLSYKGLTSLNIGGTVIPNW